MYIPTAAQFVSSPITSANMTLTLSAAPCLLQPGLVVSLHEALTPSPLFTWYSPTSATADIQMADLDTCVKYNTAATTQSNSVSEFHGSTTFTGGRHRWTVQLDNMGGVPGHIFVGLVHSEPNQAPSSSILASALPASISSRMLAMPGSLLAGSSAAAAAAGAISAAGPSSSAVAAAAGDSAAVAAAAAAAAAAGAVPGGPVKKWGVWVKLPGAPAAGALPPASTAVPPRFGDVQIVESANNHCCITVDLDLIGGYAKFFRNGHLLGQAFTGVTAPISPALAFLQVGCTLSCMRSHKVACVLTPGGCNEYSKSIATWPGDKQSCLEGVRAASWMLLLGLALQPGMHSLLPNSLSYMCMLYNNTLCTVHAALLVCRVPTSTCKLAW
jgi:hypothetical protein